MPGVIYKFPEIITDQVKKEEVKFNSPSIQARTFLFFE
jgi:hypothetical protein